MTTTDPVECVVCCPLLRCGECRLHTETKTVERVYVAYKGSNISIVQSYNGKEVEFSSTLRDPVGVYHAYEWGMVEPNGNHHRFGGITARDAEIKVSPPTQVKFAMKTVPGYCRTGVRIPDIMAPEYQLDIAL